MDFKIVKIKRWSRQFSCPFSLAVGIGFGLSFVVVTILSDLHCFQAVERPRCQAHEVWDIKPESRICRACGTTKALTEFHLNRSKPDGRDTQCRQCVVERKKEKRRRQHERESITLKITFSHSDKFWAPMDGILSLICNEMVGNECLKVHQSE